MCNGNISTQTVEQTRYARSADDWLGEVISHAALLLGDPRIMERTKVALGRWWERSLSRPSGLPSPSPSLFSQASPVSALTGPYERMRWLGLLLLGRDELKTVWSRLAPDIFRPRSTESSSAKRRFGKENRYSTVVQYSIVDCP